MTQNFFPSSKFDNYKVVGQLQSTPSNDCNVWSKDGHTFVSIPNFRKKVRDAAVKSCGRVILKPAVFARTSDLPGWQMNFTIVVAVDDNFSIAW